MAYTAAPRFDHNQPGFSFGQSIPALIADPLFWLVAVAAVILLGLSKGGFLGLGVISLPLMCIFVPPLKAAAILLPTVLAQDALTVWTYRRAWSAWNLKVLVPSMVAGVCIASLFAASLSAAHIRLAIGIIAGLFVSNQWVGTRFYTLSIRPNTFTGILFGALGGFTTMLANAGGPAWQFHLLPQRLDKFTYVGTFAILFAIGNLTKVPAYGALGQLTRENIAVGALLLPVAVLANYAGIWLVRRTPATLFYRIAHVLMLLIAIELIRGSYLELAGN